MYYVLSIKKKLNKLNAKRYTLNTSGGFIQHQLRRSGAGFTLIELLVVLVVLLVVGSILIGILVSSLRGTNKVNSINNVRRNGNYALEQMGKMIRYSRSFDGVSTDGVSYDTSCVPPTAAVPASPVIASAPPPRPGLFSKLANLIQGSVNLGKKEVSSLFSKLAILIPKFGSRGQAPQGQVAGSAVVTFTANPSDGLLQGRSDVTPPNYSCDQSDSTASYIYVGQGLSGSTFYAWRGYLSFDTSSIPDDATILAASLQLTEYANVTNTDFNLKTRYYDWGNSLSCADGDWGGNPPTGIIANNTFSTSGLPGPGNFFTISPFSNLSQINKTGLTSLMLTSDREEARTIPTGQEYLAVYTANFGTPSYRPQLSVMYSFPDPTPTPGPTSTPAPPTPIPTAVPLTQYHYVKITGFDGGQTILSCVPKESPLGVAPQIASYSGTLDSTPVNLLDTSTVNIDTCTITCTQGTVVSPPIVTIRFGLSNITSSLLPENQSSIPFQTSVTVRNY